MRAQISDLAASVKTGLSSQLRAVADLCYDPLLSPEVLRLSDPDGAQAAHLLDMESLADALRASLVPPRLPAIAGIELAATMQPADRLKIGGDFYDAFPVGKHRWGLVVGDVQGKGAKAAGLTASARHAILTAAIEHDNAAAVLQAANKTLLPDDSPCAFDAPFVTACFAMLDTAGRRPMLRTASAGHPLPTVVRANGEVFTLGQSGTLLGAFDNIDVYEAHLELHPADTVVLFTDGIFDTAGLVPLGQDGFEMLLASCADLPPSVVVERIRRAVTVCQRDDIAILAVTAA